MWCGEASGVIPAVTCGHQRRHPGVPSNGMPGTAASITRRGGGGWRMAEARGELLLSHSPPPPPISRINLVSPSHQHLGRGNGAGAFSCSLAWGVECVGRLLQIPPPCQHPSISACAVSASLTPPLPKMPHSTPDSPPCQTLTLRSLTVHPKLSFI